MCIKRIYSILTILMLCAVAGWSQTNVLSIPDVSVASGCSISLPVQLDNTTDIVALEFDLTVADGLTLQYNSATLSERAADHTLAVRSIGTNKYKVVLYSPTNTPIVGRTGKLIALPLKASSSLKEGSELALTLSDVVATGNDGANRITGYSAGKVTIAKSPDFEVSNVTASTSTIIPNGKLTVNWKVSNVGGMATTGGWSEQILLVAADGTSKLLGTLYNNNVLSAGATASRSAELNIPQIIGIDGNAKIKVKLIANSDSGEPTWLSENNAATTTNDVTVKRVLLLSAQYAEIDEATAKTLRLSLTRSGNTDADEAFNISSTTDSRLHLDPTVTIAKGQSGTYFYAQITANKTLDSNDAVTVSVAKDGYDTATAKVAIIDDTFPSLSINSDKDEFDEGSTITFTIGTQRASAQDIEVTMSCDHSSRVSLPASIVIPAGERQVKASVKIVDDEVPNLDEDFTFAVAATDHTSASTFVFVKDNDIPTLQFSIAPTAISESAGPLSITAKLSRVTNIDKKITVRIEDDSNGGLYYSTQSIEMAAGVNEATFNLGPIDNDIVDGERTYNITASVLITACSCSVNNTTSGGIVTVPLTVFDNDGPTLTLAASPATIKEGGDIEVTIKRNTNTSSALTVNLSSDHDADLDYPKTVTFAAGKSTATFTVKSKTNNTTGDSFTAILTAEANGFAKGNVWFTVTDQNLPDAQITAISASESEAGAGATVTINLTLANNGLAPLAEMTKVGIYRTGESTAVATLYLQSALAAGQSTELSQTITLPETIGKHSYYAVANDGNSESELVYTNNTSNVIEVSTVSPFSLTVSTDKSIYKKGEAMTISGKATGVGAANAPVDVYVINSGYRHVINVTTDSNGSFSTTYTPYAEQIGHFAIGACYPNEGAKTEIAAANIYGLKRKTNTVITCDATVGEPYTGTIAIENPGDLALSGLAAKVASMPSNCNVTVSAPQSVAAGQSFNLSYTLNSTSASSGDDWQQINVDLTTTQGATLTIPLYCYFRTTKATLKADIARINSSVTKGSSREYQFAITNIGKGASGKITLALPDWMSTATPREMSSLAQGDSTIVVLRIATNDKMSLNVPVTGNIGVNCENGNGFALPFSVEPVSNEEGTLTIDVCDEYTYYTAEAPHVAGATITIKHPTTGEVVESGITGSTGTYTAVLPEGYYAVSVTADKHDTYTSNCYVNPGRDEFVNVNLSYQSISVSWNVEETEVEDEYNITTTVSYETSVPQPVVQLSMPESIAAKDLAEGESLIFYATLTNKGLITAEDVEFILPTGFKALKFEALDHNEQFDLAPNQSVLIPVKVTHSSSSSAASTAKRIRPIDDDPCVGYPGTLYYWECGNDRKWHRYGIALQLGNCRNGELGTVDVSPGSGGGSGGGGSLFGPGAKPNIGGGSTYTSKTDYNKPASSTTDKGCEPCQNKALRTIANCALNHVPVLEDVWGVVKWVVDPKEAAEDWAEDKLEDIVGDIIKERAKKLIPIYGWYEVIKDYKDIYEDCIQPFTEPCEYEGSESAHARHAKAKSATPSYVAEYKSKLRYMFSAVDADIDEFYELFGDANWLDADADEMYAFVSEYVKYIDNEATADDVLKCKPKAISTETVNNLLERWVNTINDADTTNKISYDKLNEYRLTKNEVIEYAAAQGYDNVGDCYEATFNEFYDKLNESSSSVCASITLQINQKMVMTRQAFRGTLSIYNGNETTAMKDIKLTLSITDAQGNVATSHEFQINAESLNGFTGELNLTSGWQLAAQQNGTATILFIPTKYAAPTSDKVYSFGGTLSYLDPYTGLVVTRTLAPVTLTVKPSPNLDLTYFMQRDIIGDDPLTEAVEPCEEAEFALLINNVGYGDASNVVITTEQPKIIDNEKGLDIDFQLVSSQLNGGEKDLALGGNVSTDFGTIASQTTAYAQWWLTSSLLGHFNDYNVNATHVSDYGNPDLSLLNEVTIHELIRSLEINQGNNKLVGFMTNDITDANDTPDMIYLSNGEVESVATASAASINKVSETDYELTVNAATTGWTYGNVVDPTYGMSEIQSVVRKSDGKAMPLRNFWQTDRTLRDGKDPLYENRIHFADDLTKSTETYVLTFAPLPDLLLEVASIDGVPAEDVVSFEPVAEANVVFNKYIDSSSFTTDDITISVQGEQQNAKLIKISTADNKTFKLDFSALNAVAPNGYYVLTVQTAAITDSEGYTGKVGKSVGWIMFKDGLVALTKTVYPQNAGNVVATTSSEQKRVRATATTSNNNQAEYGSKITLTAVPNDGYELSNWTINGEVVSTESSVEYTVLGDIDVVANYKLKTYDVTVEDASVGGTIVNASSGIYSHGESITFEAVANDDYSFAGWTVNGAAAGKDATLTVVVTGTTTVAATFVRNIFEQSLAIERGWNWVSTYLGDEIALTAFNDNISAAIGQNAQYSSDNDIATLTAFAPGAAYKIKASYAARKTVKGHLFNIEDTPIEMSTGWNWIAYPNDATLSLAAITNPTNGDVVAGQNGFAAYLNGTWEGSLTSLTPGAGYLYKSTSAKALRYNFSAATANITATDAEVDVTAHPNTMNITARLYQGSAEVTDTTYKVYAMSGKECRGIAQLVNGNYYLTVYGDANETISFVVENTATSGSVMLNQTLTFNSDTVGSRSEPYKMKVDESTDVLSLTFNGSHNIIIYTLSGILISNNATIDTIKHLAPGYYIIDGQKYLIK